MKIKILESTCCGSGSSLERKVNGVVSELGISADVESINDFAEAIKYGVMTFPTIIVNNKIIAKGSIPSHEKLAELIKEEV